MVIRIGFPPRDTEGLARGADRRNMGA
jgi:hypothetical protein